MRREEIDFSEHNISWIKASGNCYIDLGNLNTSGTASIDTEFKFKCGEKQSSTTTVTDSLIMSPPNHGVQIYSAQIYDNGTLVRNFIPKLRDNDSKPGLYDTVNDVFYTNKGTGEFLYAYYGSDNTTHR